jgi:hypothetical protein
MCYHASPFCVVAAIATLRRQCLRDAKDRAVSTARADYPAPLLAPVRVSNSNTTEFRICPNLNKTQRITISNRNNNPNVAVRFVTNSPETSRHATAASPNTILIGPRAIRKHAYLPENKGLRQILIVNFRGTLRAAPANPAAPFWRLTAGHSFSQTISGRTPLRAAHALIESSAKSMICCEEPSYD